MAFLKYFEFVDRFPHQRTLKASGQEGHTTCFTIVASIVLLAFFFYYFPQSLYDYLTNRPYTLNITNSMLDLTQELVLPKENLDIMFTSIELSGDPEEGQVDSNPMQFAQSDSKMLEVTTRMKDKKFEVIEDPKGEILKCDDPLVSARYESFKAKSPDFSLKPAEFECLNPEKDITLGGLFLVNRSEKQIQINSEYLIKHERTEDEGEIVFRCPTARDGAYFGMIYKTFIPNYDNQSNPLDPYFIAKQIKLDNYSEIHIEMILQKTTIITNTNYLFDFFPRETREFYTLTDMEVSRQKSLKDGVDEPGRCRMETEIFIRLDQNAVIVEREYEKLDNFIANSTGLIGFIAMCLALIVGYIEANTFDEHLIKSLYYKNRVSGISKEKKLIGESSEKPSDRSEISRIMKVQTRKEVIPLRKSWCAKKKKNVLMEQASQYFEYDSDLLTIVRKQLLLEAVLAVLFDKPQIDLINLINVRKIDEKLNIDNEIAQIEEKFPLALELEHTAKRVGEQNNIRGDDYLTSKILDILEEQDN